MSLTWRVPQIGDFPWISHIKPMDSPYKKPMDEPQPGLSVPKKSTASMVALLAKSQRSMPGTGKTEVNMDYPLVN